MLEAREVVRSFGGRLQASDIIATASLAGTAHLRPGDRAAAYPAGASVTTVHIGAVIPDLGSGPLALTTLDEAARIASRGDRIDAIIVTPSAGTTPAALARTLEDRLSDRTIVTTSAERRAQAQDAVSPVVQPLLAVASMALVVGGFLVFNITAGVARRSTGCTALTGFALGVLILTYAAAGLIGRVEAAVVGLFGVPGRVAQTGLSRSPRRAWATTAAVVAAVTTVVSTTGIVANVRAAGHARAVTLLASDLIISTAANGGRVPSLGLPDALGDQLRALPGVATVAASRYGLTQLEHKLISTIAADADSNLPQYRLAPEGARRRYAHGDGVIVTAQLARALRLDVGSPLDIPTPIGLRHTSVLAVTDSFSVSPNGTLVIPTGVANGWYGATASAYELALLPGTDPRLVTQTIEGLTRDLPVDIHIATGASLIDDTIKSMDRLNSLIFAILAEAVVVAATGTLIGAIAGLALHRLSVSLLQHDSPFPIDYHPAPAALALAAIAAVLITILGAAIPARTAGRGNVITHLAAD